MDSNSINILVMGEGGTRSIGVVKALRRSEYDLHIIGTDANYFNAGIAFCDESYIIPLASEPSYQKCLTNIITKNNIQIIFSTVEKEIKVLSSIKKDIENSTGTVVMVPDSKRLDIFFNKLKTQQFLKKHNLNYIPTILCRDRKECLSFAQEQGFPLIRKPLFGYGSKGLTVINSTEDLNDTPMDETYVLQKYVDDDTKETIYSITLDEYSAEIFTNRDGSIAGGIILKRTLHNGETLAGHLVRDEQMLSYLTSVSKAIGILGPINLQFKVNHGQVYIFEVNPLMSGTTAIRAKLGFSSPELCLSSFVLGKHLKINQNQLSDEYFIRYLETITFKKPMLEKLKKAKHIINE